MEFFLSNRQSFFINFLSGGEPEMRHVLNKLSMLTAQFRPTGDAIDIQAAPEDGVRNDGTVAGMAEAVVGAGASAIMSVLPQGLKNQIKTTGVGERVMGHIGRGNRLAEWTRKWRRWEISVS